ncbi:GMC family oxidoreductase [Hugenholtzia roseola]|uniref:GMC family oxidoreductase n=1 Tax=Hugenholtzia roseola TaxID=1002 RepID=UPI0004049941|nr:GMC family oxidoreductase [Hugenholtzia roseola]
MQTEKISPQKSIPQPTLSKSLETIASHYEVVVIGSGYGGSIMASRLARAGRQVCLLERGKEFRAGDFPDTQLEAAAEFQVQTPQKHIGNELGLYDFHIGKDINVFVGCGLGGTSLVNANVAIRPEKRVFEDPLFPKILREEFEKEGSFLEKGYQRAWSMLKPNPYPDTFPPLAKMQAMQKSAAALQEPFRKLDITVNFEKESLNQVGVPQKPCNLCGDCVSGCNQQAKNTLTMNYLPDAVAHGASIFTQISVQYIEQVEQEGKKVWNIYYKIAGAGRKLFTEALSFISADYVVVAAGTLGSSQILLRSKEKGLPLSEQVGKHFSGNGDVLGFGFNNDQNINGIGWGARKEDPQNPVGPCITSVIDMRNRPNLNEGMVIEEGSVPGAMAATFPQLFMPLAGKIGTDTDEGLSDKIGEKLRILESWVWQGAYKGAMQNTQTFLVMTHDDSKGELLLENDRLKISWKGVGKQPIFETVNENLYKATEALGGTYVPNPIWTDLFEHDLVTVHPLGGCIMAENAEKGVVNHKGQVFDVSQGKEGAVFETLYVADGSIVPRSLGANPFLTISALAERTALLLCQEKGWQMEEGFEKNATFFAQKAETKPRRGVQFSEQMEGFISTQSQHWTNATGYEAYQKAFEAGKNNDSACEITVTIVIHDLEALIENPAHYAQTAGTVTAPALSAQPLTFAEGNFNVLSADPDRMAAKNMIYHACLESVEGNYFWFEGYKVVRNDKGFDAWADTTTLYTTIYEGKNNKGKVVAKGILHISPIGFAKQLATLQALHTDNLIDSLKVKTLWGKFAFGSIFDTYGGIFAKDTLFNPDTPPRKKRPLHTSTPELHSVRTSDGIDLLLTRYKPQNQEVKGVVALSHGFSVSGLIFQMDTLEPNLVEFLYQNGYEVWVMEYRTSILLPSASRQSTADEVALQDYPALLGKILEVTGEKEVHLVTHCVGAITAVMALLSGLKGVKSLTCFQIAAHVMGGTQIELKANLHVPTLLHKLGMESISAYTDENASWLDKLLNKVVKLYAQPLGAATNDPISNRVTFMFAPLYEKENINPATFEAFHEMFGIANMTMYEHLTLMTRQKQLVNAEGQDVYMPHLQSRLNLPICFIHGAENQVFAPIATQTTYQELCRLNGAEKYSYHLIEGYGHQDCVIGKEAAQDVFAHVLAHLEKWA